MTFSEQLKETMKQLNITQKQLVTLTGISKSGISQYLAGKNLPTEERRRKMAMQLGLKEDYFVGVATDLPEAKTVSSELAAESEGVKKISVNDAAKLLGMHHLTVRKGLQQGVFPWGYAVQTSNNRWVYFINAVSLSETEHIKIKGV